MRTPPDPDARAAPPAGRVAWLVFFTVLPVYAATAGGSLTSTDAVVSYNLTASLVERGSIALATRQAGAQTGHDGRDYSWFGIGHSVYNIPFYVAGRAAGSLLGQRLGKPDSVTKAVVALGSVLPAAACAPIVFLFAWRLTTAIGPSLIAAFALAFGSILWPYSKFGFNMPLAACLVIGGAYLVWSGVRTSSPPRLAGGGALLGYALLTRHELPVLFVPLLVWVVAESWPDLRRAFRNLSWIGVPLVVAVAIWLAYNQARFGHPLDTGQRIAGQPAIEMLRSPFSTFGRTMGASLAGLLAAPGASLFIYSPAVMLGIASLALLGRRDRSTAVLFGAQSLAYVLFMASAGNWWAGRSYGSRYLVPIVPILCVPIACWFSDGHRRLRILGAGLLAASVIVQLPGVLVDYSKVEMDDARLRGGRWTTARLWSWDSADLVINARAASRAIPVNLRYLAGAGTPPPVDRTAPADRRDFGQQFSFSLDFWWLYLFYMGAVPAPVALLGVAVPLGVAAACLWRLRALLRGASQGPAGTVR